MKKIATLFFLFFLVWILYPRETSIPVFEENNEEKSFFYYDIYPRSLTTQTFIQVFSGYEVISLIPKINPLLENQIKKEAPYIFTSDTLENNLYSFSKQYIETLQNHGFNKEASTLSIKGIPIYKVTLFTTYKTYQKLAHQLE